MEISLGNLYIKEKCYRDINYWYSDREKPGTESNWNEKKKLDTNCTILLLTFLVVKQVLNSSLAIWKPVVILQIKLTGWQSSVNTSLSTTHSILHLNDFVLVFSSASGKQQRNVFSPFRLINAEQIMWIANNYKKANCFDFFHLVFCS